MGAALALALVVASGTLVELPSASAQTPPSVDTVSAGNVTNTGATVTITVANAGTSPIIVHARVFIGDTMEYFPLVESTTTGTAEFTLNTLPGGTTYHIEASLDSSFETGVIRESFTTLPADYTITGVTIGSRTHTSAVATITSTGPGVINKYVTLRIRPVGTTIWDRLVSINFSPLSVDVDLEDLTPGTEYELHVSTDESYLGGQNLYVRFTTLKVRVSEIAVSGNIHQTSLGLDVTILDPDGLKQYIFLRYRATPSGSWTYFRSHSSTDQGDGVLFGLTSATDYEVEASIDFSFPAGETASTTFTTLPPDLDRVTVDDVTQTSATVAVAIGAPNGQPQTVYVQYRRNVDTAWTDAPNVTTRTANGDLALSGLTSGTEYEVQASLDDTFPSGETESTSFTTEPPVVTGLRVDNVTQTTADVTVTISEPNGQPQVINVVYGGRISNSPATERTVTTSTDTATITLTGLLPDIAYDVRARVLDDRFITPRSVVANFDTQPPDPSLVSISVRTVTGTYTEIWMAVANNNSGTRMHSRYRETPDGPWSTTTSSNAGRSTFVRHLNSLNANTEYEAQLSLYPSFPAAETQSITFTSLQANPSLEHLNVVEARIMQTEATATVTIADPSGTETVYLRRRELPFGSWGNVQTETTTTSTVDFTLSSLTAGAQYQIQASQDAAFPYNDTLSELFTTAPPDPAIYEVYIGNRQGLSLSVGVRISNVRSRLPVYLRYRTTPSGPWSSVQEEVARTPDAFLDVAFDVRGLTPAVEYEFEVSLDSSFPPAETSNISDTTAPSSVSSLAVQARLESAATLVASLRWVDGQEREVYTRYRKVGVNEWTDGPTAPTTTDRAVFELTGLFGGTDYEAQASTHSGFPVGAGKVTFTTLPPRITDVTIYSYAQTEVWVRIGLAGVSSDNVIQMNSRYRRTSPLGPWINLIHSPPPPPTPGPTESLVAPLDGLEQETGYEYAESLDIHFAANATKSVRFNTLWATVAGVEVVDETQDGAMLNVLLQSTDGSNRTVYGRYRPVGSEGQWTTGARASTSTDAVTIELRRLRAGAEYDVEVSTYGNFPAYATTATTLTTEPARIEGLSLKSVGKTEAEVNVDFAGHNLYVVLTYYRYRALRSGSWSPTYVEVGTTRGTRTRLEHRLPLFMSGTEYDLQASTDPTFPSPGSWTLTFTTAAPALFSLKVENVTATEAEVTVNLDAPNSNTKTVFLQYRRRGESEWSNLPNIVTATATGTHMLEGLLANTVYELRASLDYTFPSGETATARVETANAGVSSFVVSSFGKTEVELTITLSDPIGGAQLFLIRVTNIDIPRNERARAKLSMTTPTATVKLSGLSPATSYAAFAIVESPSFAVVRFLPLFETLPPDSRLSFAYVDDTTSNAAEVTVAVEDRYDREPMVYLRHRAAGEADWEQTSSRQASTDEVAFPLFGLDPGVRHDVEVSLEMTFPAGMTTSASFTTLQATPTLSGLSIADITQTSAEATVSIQSPIGTQRVYLRHRQLPNGRWSSAQPESTDNGTAEFPLTGLAPGFKYQIEASMNSSFPAADTRTRVIATLPPDPSVARIQILEIDGYDFKMEIHFAHGGTTMKTVHLRYREVGNRDWNSNVFNTTTTATDLVEMDPDGLKPETLYEFEASLDDTFPRGATASTTVKSEPPKVVGVTVGVVEQNTVELTTTVKFSAQEDQPVYTRYRTLPSGRWVNAPKGMVDNPSSSEKVTVDYSVTGLTAGKDYEIEAATEPGFRFRHIRTFTTLPPTTSGVHVHEKSPRQVGVSVSTKARRDGVTVYTRYRSGSAWTNRNPVEAPPGHVLDFQLDGLMPGEEYELQASVEDDYPGPNTKSFMFSTLGDTPTNESLNENGVTKDSAKAMVKVHSPDGTEHMVHLRCRELGESGWTPMTPEMTTDLEVTFDLTNLKEDTLYEMQAALNSSFDADSVLSRVFATRGGSTTTTTTTTTTGGGGGGGGFGPAPVAPKFSDGFRASRSLTENARPGDAVGDPIAATHPDDFEITYSISGTDAASFTVDEETGQIRVKEGVALVLGQTLTLNLTATDSAGFGAIIIVAIEVVEAMHHLYDANRNGNIERDEVIAAVKDYFDGDISKDEVIDLIKLYFSESD